MGPFFELLRPRQWTKNLLIFAPVLFARKAMEGPPLWDSVVAFFAFCLVSSAVYIMNDAVDAEKDRLHPQKCHRPIASGRVSRRAAFGWGALVLALSLALAVFFLNPEFLKILLFYFGLMMGYTLVLKHQVIMDVLIIAVGFVSRAAAGAIAIHVPLSPWLFICTFLLSLFLALAKRKNELLVLGSETAHRDVLGDYNDRLLDQMIAISASSVLVSYALYTVDQAVGQGHHYWMPVSLLFVIYGIFRYLYLVYSRNQGGKPEEILLTDLPLLADIFLFCLFAMWALY